MSLAATAGGLVFGGDANGHFKALDDRTGKVLWDMNLGSSVSGYPICFAADGKQYVAVITGPSLVANSEARVAGAAAGQRAKRVRLRAAVSDDVNAETREACLGHCLTANAIHESTKTRRIRSFKLLGFQFVDGAIVAECDWAVFCDYAFEDNTGQALFDWPLSLHPCGVVSGESSDAVLRRPSCRSAPRADGRHSGSDRPERRDAHDAHRERQHRSYRGRHRQHPPERGRPTTSGSGSLHVYRSDWRQGAANDNAHRHQDPEQRSSRTDPLELCSNAQSTPRTRRKLLAPERLCDLGALRGSTLTSYGSR